MDVHRVEVPPEIAGLIEAVERGDSVEFVRAGAVVAELRPKEVPAEASAELQAGKAPAEGTKRSGDWLDELRALQAAVPTAARGGSGSVSALRDLDP